MGIVPDVVHLSAPKGLPTPPPMVVLSVEALPPGAFPLDGHSSERLQYAIDKDTAILLRNALAALTSGY
jgi:hypothetical protein